MVLILKMNLIIDVGNSYIKLAVFQQDELIVKKVLKSEVLIEQVDILRSKNNIDKAILSSVGKLKETELAYLRKYFDLVELNSTTVVPFVNLYKTPHTLGLDRIALVSASIKQF